VLARPCKCFEVALFTGAIWLSGRLGITNQAAIKTKFSIIYFMFAMGLSVAATIRVGNQKA
jgi:MATE family multidrug resistance protein